MDPLLRQSDAGRAVFVTSGAAHKATPFWGGYAVTKAALEMMAQTYAAESAGGKVRVNLFNPGATRTIMRKKAMPGEDPATLKTPDDVAPQIVALLSPSCDLNGQTVSYQPQR
jgi:NAD(P)-dependent dehydrogenase (short-subunit alcohol dehydrogenase family)